VVQSNAVAVNEGTAVPTSLATLFVCANCARPGKIENSAGRTPPVVPNFNWPCPVQQIIVPCAGRLQPEHVLKAFEAGSSVVSVVACREDNCHYIEGSLRCGRRAEYLRSILTEIGLGGNRLLLFSLPGSAAEDLALLAGAKASAVPGVDLEEQVAAIRDQVVRALLELPPNPLQKLNSDETVSGSCRMEDDDDDE
jgi:F420-non-reducing hydrogenase iron-sulfur subunit